MLKHVKSHTKVDVKSSVKVNVPPMDKKEMEDALKLMEKIARRKTRGLFLVVGIEDINKNEYQAEGAGFIHEVSKEDIVQMAVEGLHIDRKDLFLYFLKTK